MILDIYKDAFEYAGQNVLTLIKLGVLSLLSFLIIPEFLVIGYQYRVIESGINGMVDGDDKLPEFDNFTGMFVDGLKMFVVQIAYIIIPIILMALGVVLGNIDGSGTVSAILFIVGGILAIISIFYSFLAVPNMIANEGAIKKAFDFKRINEIIEMIGVGKYVIFVIGIFLITLVISAVVGIIIMLVFGILGIASVLVNPISSGIIFIVGGIIYFAIFSFIVTPYLSIFSGRSNGLIYGVGA